MRLGMAWKFCLWYPWFWWNCFCNSKINFSGSVKLYHKAIKCFWFLSVLSEQWPKQAMLCSPFQRNNSNVRLWIVNTDSPQLLTITPSSQCKIKQLTGMDATWCFWPTAGRCKCAFQSVLYGSLCVDLYCTLCKRVKRRPWNCRNSYCSWCILKLVYWIWWWWWL